MSDEVQITVRVNNQTGPGITSVNQTINRLSRTARDGNRDFQGLRATLLSLAPAAIPVAASLAPIAVRAGAAGVAVAAFGAAVVPQIANLKSAADAQDKYTTAVTKYGANSKQAVQAQQFVADTLKGMPAATQRAAAGYSVLRDQFHAFSDSTARFTMAPVEHSFAVVGALLPKLKPMVEGTSTQFDRLVKVAGGAINTSGFDALSKKVSDLANNSLQRATDSAIHFIRVLSEGNAQGPMTAFFAYAKAQGPAVRELLSNLVQALGNVTKGAAEAGPGMLSIVNAMAKLVAAVPPSLIGNLMQVYTAFKLIKLAGGGIGSVAGGVQTLAAKLAALQTVAVGAGGGLAGLKAAFLSLGTAAKATVVLTLLSGLAIAAYKLSSSGKDARVSIDALSKSIEEGLIKGHISSTVIDDLRKAQQGLVKDTDSSASAWDRFAYSFSHFGATWSSSASSTKAATNDFRDLGKAVGEIAKNKGVDTARQALALLAKQGVHIPIKYLKDYNSAVADAALESKLTAQSMGLFGQAAQDTSAKLQVQKASADGLRQSIQALNDVNRQGLGGMIGFEAAIDAAAKAAKTNHGALSMTNGVLNLNSERARNAASALQDLADKTDAAGTSQREAGASWETANGIYSRGRAQLIKQAQAMGLTRDQAKALASQLLQIPTDKVSRVKLDDEDAKAGLEAFNAALKRTPGAKSVTLKTLSSSAEAVLEAFGFKVKHLPNGKVKVSAANGQALSALSSVAAMMRSLDGRTSNTYVRTYFQSIGRPGEKVPAAHRPDLATGGLVRGYAGGGDVQSFPDGGYVQGPGSGTSDSILAFMGSGAMARVSNTEYVVKAAAVRKYGTRMLDAINSGRLEVPGYAKGGHLTKKQKAAKAAAEAQAKSEAEGRSEAWPLLSVSHFGRMAGWKQDEFQTALGKPDSVSSLVNALNQWRGIIQKATHGGTETRLLKQLDSAGKKLLAWEKQLNAVTKNLASAKDKLASLKDAAASLASSVKGNLLSSANITRGAGEGGPVTLSSIKAGMRISKDKVTAFAAALKQLKAKGFSKSIIQQVAEAGIDGGGLETAGALLQASASEVKTINQTQATIDKAAGSAGKTAADVVYGKAIRQQERYVKSLEAQQKKLTTSMDNLAKAMEKAIKNALGSGKKHGKKASGGIASGLTMVGEQGFELLDLPAGSRVWSNPDSRRMLAQGQAPWSSMLSAPRRAPTVSAPAGSAGPSQPIVIRLQLGRHEFEEIWVDVGRRAVQTRGSIEATLRPPRGR